MRIHEYIPSWIAAEAESHPIILVNLGRQLDIDVPAVGAPGDAELVVDEGPAVGELGGHPAGGRHARRLLLAQAQRRGSRCGEVEQERDSRWWLSFLRRCAVARHFLLRPHLCQI